MGGEAEEYLVQITRIPSKENAAEKGEPKTVRAAQHLFSDLQVLDKLTRNNDHSLQPVHPTEISLAWYGLGYLSEEVFGSGLSMTKE